MTFLTQARLAKTKNENIYKTQVSQMFFGSLLAHDPSARAHGTQAQQLPAKEEKAGGTLAAGAHPLNRRYG